MTPADPDMFARPDADSLIILPWNREVGWLASELWMSGQPVEASPRTILRRQVEAAAKSGHRMKTGVECEYFMINSAGTAISDPDDTQSKPCYDQVALMRRFPVIKDICDAMIELGWGPYQNDHEDANGQFEMNWDYDDAMVTADRHVFFKYMVKTIAAEHGHRATFMPKPFKDLTGNGCHTHASMWDKAGKKNTFLDTKDEMGLSKLAYSFLGGVLNSAESLCAIFNPTVNSYKRINAPVTLSGATWSPNAVSYTGNNRTHMVRIPDAGRFEFRLMDGATNPYLSPLRCWRRASMALITNVRPANASTSTCTNTAQRCGGSKSCQPLCWTRSVCSRKAKSSNKPGVPTSSIPTSNSKWMSGTLTPATSPTGSASGRWIVSWLTISIKCHLRVPSLGKTNS